MTGGNQHGSPAVRVRFAPSPTGPLHIGGIRTALYNWLFARKHKGSFILRLEDTDRTRFVPGAEEYIIKSLVWSGLAPDEGPGIGGDFGPYRQSERADLYRYYAAMLLKSGHAYYAFDTPAELEAVRGDAQAQGKHAFKYDHQTRIRMRNSLSMTQEAVNQLLDSGAPYTLRLKVPAGETVTLADVVRGEVSFQTNELDDKVLMKADGLPTYHLANVIDDHLMKISHVIRGEEWLSSTAHHILLYRAFGWEHQMPVFAHIPLILKPAGKGKLSKRDGAKFGFPVFPLSWEGQFEGFKEYGILPEAMLNFLAFLGWNPGTEREIFSIDELIDAFSLDNISKSGARFDIDKALWFNGHYIQQSKAEALLGGLQKLTAKDDQWHRAFIDLYRDRAKRLGEFEDLLQIYANSPTSFEEGIVRKKWSAEMSDHFSAIAAEIGNLSAFDHRTLETAIKAYIQEHSLRFGEVFQLIRTALSGTPKGPDLFHMLILIGQEETAQRMWRAIDVFNELMTARADG